MNSGDSRRLRGDPSGGYGWTSIVLHWASGLVVLVLLGIGVNIPSAIGQEMLRLHTSLALVCYALLVARIVWRMRYGHPASLDRRGRWEMRIARIIHYALLAAIGVMLVSGPLMAWTGGLPLNVFGLFDISGPIGPDPAAFQLLHAVHSWTAAGIGVGVCLHVAGALKHIIIDRDKVFDRIMVAAKEPDA